LWSCQSIKLPALERDERPLVPLLPNSSAKSKHWDVWFQREVVNVRALSLLWYSHKSP
jgi:hypothetical protein